MQRYAVIAVAVCILKVDVEIGLDLMQLTTEVWVSQGAL